ncbi:MAG: CNNM domain-containing protein [Chitinispirillales bacterium]|jgi:putative hemolysin|nr:CNNM domain-containing protein [Chitinispirillales bacterium]
MDTNIIVLFAVNFCFILLSAFFSASETALFSIPRERIDSFQDHRAHSRRLIYLLLKDGQRTLLLLLVCNLFVNITLTGLINSLMTAILGKSSVLWSFAAATAIIITFGEIAPKTGALRWNEKIAGFAAPVIYNLKIVSSPLLNLIQRINRFFLARFKRYLRNPSPFITVDELKSALCSSLERGVISKSEQRIITNLLDRGAQPVKRFMIHRSQMPFLPHYTTVSDALKELVRTSQTYALITRSPRSQQVIGVVCLHTLLSASPTNRCRQLAKNPQWVPETLVAADLIGFMFAQKLDIACVLDEFGGLSGVFSLADGLGRVMNFRQEQEGEGQGKGGSARVFLGLQEIDGMEDWLPESLLSMSENVRTLNGLLTRYLGRIPKTGERFEIDGRNFCIMYSAGNRVESVLIRKSS